VKRRACSYCGRLTTALDDDGDPACPPDACGRRARVRLVPARLEYRGEARTLRDLSLVAGVPTRVLRWRLSAGWEIARAVETPPATHGGPRSRA